MDITRRNFLKSSSALAAFAATGASFEASAAEKLTYWHHLTSQTEMKGLAQVVGQFEAAGGAVRAENIPNKDYMSKITTANVSGSLPDSMMIVGDRLPDMHAMGALTAVTDKVNSWDKKGNYSDVVWDSITLGNEIYGLPAFGIIGWGYYRKDWFAEKGLSVPTTMEEFAETAVALTDKSKGRFGFGLRGGGGGQVFFHDLLDSYGAIIYADGKASLDTEKTRQALGFYAGLGTELGVVPESAPNDSYRQIMEGFKTGQTGMIWHHTGSLVELREAMGDDKLGTMMRPAGPAGAIARSIWLYNGLSSSANMDAGWEWIKTWTTPDAAIAMLNATGYFPASSEVQADPRIADNPLFAPAVVAAGLGLVPPKVVGLGGWLTQSALSELQKVLVGSSDVNSAVDRMAFELDKAMK